MIINFFGFLHLLLFMGNFTEKGTSRIGKTRFFVFFFEKLGSQEISGLSKVFIQSPDGIPNL